MAANDYVSVTLWRVPGNVDRAYRVLVDIENYPRWWPEVYLRVEPLTPLRKTIGDKVRLLTRGIWSLKQQGSEVVLTFDWRLRAQKRLIRNLSWLFKALFRWNHRWAMDRGEEGLSREMMSAR